VGSAPDKVRSVRRYAPGPARLERLLLRAHAEADGSAQDDPELLVLVAVLRQLRVRLDLDDRERHAAAVEGAREVPRRELPGRDRAEIAQGAHEQPAAGALRAGHRRRV